MCEQGGEGIVSKKASAPYSGTRTRNWLKIKCIQRQEFVIVGWSESDKRIGFRSLLLAAKEKGQADLCRQGRHRFQRQADPGPARPDEAARGRQGPGRGAARRPQGRALRQAGARRRDRLHRVHATTASSATRASSACARTSRRPRWWSRRRSISRRRRRKPRSRPPKASGSRSAIPIGSSIPRTTSPRPTSPIITPRSSR